MLYRFIKQTEAAFSRWYDFEDVRISDILKRFDNHSITTVVILSRDKKLAGVITEGDIRRGILGGLTVHDPIHDLVNRSPVVSGDTQISNSDEDAFVANRIDLVPVVIDGEFAGILVNPTFTQMTEVEFIIMAGGKGTRLKPFTEDCPKPMVEIADKPMIEHIILNAKSHGFTNFTITLNYLGHMIVDHLGDGSRLGVNVSYVQEEEPLGTAGALSLLEKPPEHPFIVSNGDVVTQLNYREFYNAHLSNGAVASMAVKRHDIQNQFGVVHTDGTTIVGFEEKPVYTSQINAGVYVLNPETLSLLPTNSYCDMPNLFMKLRAANMHLLAFAIFESWLDVGNPNDLHQARKTLSS